MAKAGLPQAIVRRFNPGNVSPRRLKAQRGAYLIEFAGVFLVSLMVASLGIDFGIYFTKQKQLETAAEAAALAAAGELWNDTSSSANDRQDSAKLAAIQYADANLDGTSISTEDVVFGMADPQTRTYDQSNFSTTTNNPLYAFTGGYNAVRVAAWRTDEGGHGNTSALPTLTAKLFQTMKMDTVGYAVAQLDRDVGSFSTGLRPFYLCQGEFDLAMADGDPTNDTVRIYGNHIWLNGQTSIPNCPASGSGNWGFADLRNGSPGAVGNSTIADWILNGFSGGTVSVGTSYSTQPGNSISSSSVQSALDTLIANETVVTIPLYDQYSGSGSNTSVHVSAFTGFRITGYQATGPATSRYVEGYMVNALCTTDCSVGNGTSTNGGGIAKLRLIGSN